MGLEIYLIFNGNCKEAVEFYAKVFSTEVKEIMTFGMMKDQNVKEEYKEKILHTYLQIDNSTLMLSDCNPGDHVTFGNNVQLTYSSKDYEKVQKVYEGLKEGGKVGMELQATFFAKVFAMVTDKFGVGWKIYQTK
ncbi:MAG: VOC family protein [Alphaproteobacteria bacterium]|jgi:PhnB protein